ncbi:hypothetical protein D3C84_1172740 [compost metagenome]
MQNIVHRFLELYRTRISCGKLGFHRTAQTQVMAKQHLHVHIGQDMRHRVVSQHMAVVIRRRKHRRIRRNIGTTGSR